MILKDTNKELDLELFLQAKQLGLDRYPEFNRIFRLLEVDPEDRELLELLKEVIEKHKTINTTHPNPFRSTSPIAQLPGSIFLGKIYETDIPYFIDLQILRRNTLICGASGAGKSNIIFFLTALLLKAGITVRIYDRKSEYHALSIDPNFSYLLFEDYFDNWLEASPGITKKSWILKLAEAKGNYLDIRVAARGLLSNKALWLIKQADISNKPHPNLKDVYHLIKNTKYPPYSHEARYKETLVNRLQSLITIFGENVCSHKRIKWDNYFNGSWGISLSSLPTDYQNLFISIDVTRLMSYKEGYNFRDNQLSHILVFDEASQMFKKYHEQREGTYLLTDYLAKCREFGIGFLIATQTMSNLADSAIANTSLKIFANASLGSDYDLFASATGMNNEQKQFLKKVLRPGIVCVKDPRYPEPFLVEVPLVVQ